MTSSVQRLAPRSLASVGTLACILIALAGILGLQGMTMQATREGLSDEYVIRKEQNFAIASTLDSLGYGSLAASWLWMEFIQYYGDTPARRREGYSLTYDYLDKITQLDDQFLRAYRYIAVTVGFSAGQPQLADQLMQRGLEAMTPQTQPEGYRLHLDRAVNYFLLLGDPEAGRRSYYAAGQWFQQAGLQGDQPEGWRQLGDRLVESPDSEEVQFMVWYQVFNSTADPVTQERALIEMSQLGGQMERDHEGRLRVIPPWDLEPQSQE